MHCTDLFPPLDGVLDGLLCSSLDIGCCDGVRLVDGVQSTIRYTHEQYREFERRIGLEVIPVSTTQQANSYEDTKDEEPVCKPLRPSHWIHGINFLLLTTDGFCGKMTDTLDEIWDSLFGGGGGPAEPSSSSAPPQPSNPVVVVASRPAPAPSVPPPSIVVVPTRPAPTPVVVPTKPVEEAYDDGESFFADCCSRTCIIALLLLVASGASIGVIYVVVSLFNADVRDAYTDRINIAKNSFTEDVTRVRAIPSLYNSSDLAPVGTKGPPGGRGVIGPHGFSAPGATGLPGPYGPSATGITGPTVRSGSWLACLLLLTRLVKKTGSRGSTRSTGPGWGARATGVDGLGWATGGYRHPGTTRGFRHMRWNVHHVPVHHQWHRDDDLERGTRLERDGPGLRDLAQCLGRGRTRTGGQLLDRVHWRGTQTPTRAGPFGSDECLHRDRPFGPERVRDLEHDNHDHDAQSIGWPSGDKNDGNHTC